MIHRQKQKNKTKTNQQSMISSPNQTKSPRSERLHAAFMETLKLRPRIPSELPVLILTVSLNCKNLWIGRKERETRNKRIWCIEIMFLFQSHIAFQMQTHKGAKCSLFRVQAERESAN